jgi:aryl-alcohol dehydrogenase-like predicted oxidoreductase
MTKGVDMSEHRNNKKVISRRNFFKISGALTAGSALSTGMAPGKVLANNRQNQEIKIKEYRTLGRTGYKVSDISMGTLRVKEPNVIRYAYDAGINYFDNAEVYQNGEAERKLGQALAHMDRKKIFLTTKIHVAEDETEESILKRFTACQERMKTDYIDCFYMHGVTKVSLLDKPEYHSAVSKLKNEGRLRFSGLSSHGPRRKEEDSMEKVLTTAAYDGRFDVMLLVYNFMNEKAANNIIKACKENNVGATAMKTSPGVLTGDKYDPENPSEAQKKQLKKLRGRHDSEEEIEKRMNDWVKEQQDDYLKTKQFA